MALPRDYATVVRIAASPETVWTVLTDPVHYADWNPEIVAIDGRFALGERITARVHIGDGVMRSVPMRVTTFESPVRMEWVGGLPLGLFVGRRVFSVTPCDGGAEFRMELHMTGVLSPLIIRSVGHRQAEIDSFSAALKKRVEGVLVRGDVQQTVAKSARAGSYRS
jgi:hypothetical protein